MDFSKREQRLLKYIEKHGTRPHLLVISLIGILIGVVAGIFLAIKGFFSIVEVFYLVFLCALSLMLCAIANLRISFFIIQKYKKSVK